jgi:Uma2 family endonuclease
MELAVQKVAEKFTYGDYLSWDDGKRWEIIYSQAYDITPAPDTIHQLTLVEIIVQLMTQLKGKPCRVFAAPFDVRLPLGKEKEEDIENVVQPDILIVCDARKIDKKGCLGAPDMIIEILSPSTSRKDRKEKFVLYERVGVKEYWLVSPDEKLVEVFRLGPGGKYGRPEIYCEIDKVQLGILKKIAIDLSVVFSIEVSISK